jgi:hypothetical protein
VLVCENNPGLVAAVERWILVSGISPGEPLFRSIKKGGHIRGRLRDGDVSLALKERIARYLEGSGYTREAANAEVAKYSGHSGRVTSRRRLPRAKSGARGRGVGHGDCCRTFHVCHGKPCSNKSGTRPGVDGSHRQR